MRVRDDVLLWHHYDVIVVGAGLGGLTAASLLAKRGLAVLLIEQQNKPGGSCTSFKREGVVYDVGTAMLYGFGERGFKPFRFLLNELEEPIEMVAHPTLARMTFEGQEIVFWPDVDRSVRIARGGPRRIPRRSTGCPSRANPSRGPRTRWSPSWRSASSSDRSAPGSVRPSSRFWTPTRAR